MIILRGVYFLTADDETVVNMYYVKELLRGVNVYQTNYVELTQVRNVLF